MGPGSDNPGYASTGPKTSPARSASMGPGSDNPGYADCSNQRTVGRNWLQWVRGRITPVMVDNLWTQAMQHLASMGPGPDNPGFGQHSPQRPAGRLASMGPGSHNPGYDRRFGVASRSR